MEHHLRDFRPPSPSAHAGVSAIADGIGRGRSCAVRLLLAARRIRRPCAALRAVCCAAPATLHAMSHGSTSSERARHVAGARCDTCRVVRMRRSLTGGCKRCQASSKRASSPTWRRVRPGAPLCWLRRPGTRTVGPTRRRTVAFNGRRRAVGCGIGRHPAGAAVAYWPRFVLLCAAEVLVAKLDGSVQRLCRDAS